MSSHPLRGIWCHIKQERLLSRPHKEMSSPPLFLTHRAPWVCFPPTFYQKKKKKNGNERKDPLTFLFILETSSVMQ